MWMSSWGDCGITFPGISMTNGGLVISQLDVIDTAQIKALAVKTGQIDDLAVSTLKIGNNAVSFSVYSKTNHTDYYFDGELYSRTWLSPNITSGSRDYVLATLSITSTGAPLTIMISPESLGGDPAFMEVSGSANMYPTSSIIVQVDNGSGGWFDAQTLSSITRTLSTNGGVRSNIPTMITQLTGLSAGSRTIRIIQRSSVTYTGNQASIYAKVSNVGLFVIENKK